MSQDTAVRLPSTRLEGETYAQQVARLGYLPHSSGEDDKRGSAADRRRRRLILVGALAPKRGPRPGVVGNGRTVPCAHACGTQLSTLTLTVDRIDPHGTYQLTNVQAACGRCNKARGDNVDWRYSPARDGWGPNSLVSQN